MTNAFLIRSLTAAALALSLSGPAFAQNIVGKDKTGPVPNPVNLDITGMFQSKFVSVGDDMFIGGQPTEKALRDLRAKGVTTVVNLRMPQEMAQVGFDEAALVKELGIKYVTIPMRGTPENPYGPKELDTFTAAMASADGKVLLHCTIAWRASHLWGAYLIRERKTPVATALAQARSINLMDDMRMGNSDTQPLEGFLGHAVPEMGHPKQWPKVEGDNRMRTRTWIAVSSIALLAAMPLAAQQRGAAPAAAAVMTMTVDGFADGTDVPVKYSQAAPGVATGEGLSPAISWANVPAGTQSFFLNMHDLDLARNKTTDDQAHWVVWNLPATATGLPEGVPKGPKLANGAFQISATGTMYRGPGAGANGPKHHYVFELFALDTMLDVQPTADAFETRTNVMKAVQGHILAKAVYGGLFRRPQ